ncbi:hypothetical protein [Peribacillus alkalitolerans]|uniref:hypothetical protein n=1 Tax=Peribacillus alkalitolerans TaxID=1550385 RepID=UPI0019676206|nr:hypothetical protein [Peribacillus alkalitolerans]
MCGIDFVMAVTVKEAEKAEKYVHFDERIHDYLRKRENNQSIDFNLLLSLNPYGDKIIFTKDIPDLINNCEKILLKYNSKEDIEREVRNFASELKEFCKEAIILKKHIFALGD